MTPTSTLKESVMDKNICRKQARPKSLIDKAKLDVHLTPPPPERLYDVF